MKISIALDFIRKKRIEFLLSIIAGVLLFYFFDTYIFEYDRVFYVENQVQHCFDKDLKKIYRLTYDDYLSDNYYSFYNELYTLGGYEKYGTFDDSSAYFIEYGVNYDKYFYPDGFDGEDEGMEYRVLDVYNSCAELLNIYDIDGNKLTPDTKKQRMVVEERQKTKQDENVTAVFPIYAGYGFKETMPLGTILKECYLEEELPPDANFEEAEFKCYEYIVVGYLAENQKFLSSNSIEYEYGNLVNLDRTIIILKDVLRKDTIYEDYYFWPTGFFFTSDNPDRTIEDIKNLAKVYGIKVNIEKVSDVIDTMKKNQLSEVRYYGFMLVLMVCVSLIFLTFTSLMILMVRKNEIGILYANGVSHWDMSKMIYAINVICTGIAGCVAFTIRTIVINNESDGYAPGDLELIQNVRKMYISWQIAVLCLLIALISSVISIKVLDRYSIRELIGNNE